MNDRLGWLSALVSALALVACSGGDPAAQSDEGALTEGDPGDASEVGGCSAHSDCTTGEYCAFDDGVCGVERGICKTASVDCPTTEWVVCGCDGVTYFNGCEAGRFGVSVAYEGACAAQAPQQAPVPGGCAGNGDCASGEYCDFGDGTCGEQGPTGSCKAKGGPCTGKYEPVCGCNGKTYDTKCEALVSGVSIRHVGACR